MLDNFQAIHRKSVCQLVLVFCLECDRIKHMILIGPMMKKYFLLECLIASLMAIFSNSVTAAEQNSYSENTIIPRSILFGNPDHCAVRVSPDGKHLSYSAPDEGVMNIFVAPVDDVKKAKAITFDRGRGITSYTWTYLPGILIYSQDHDGDENDRLFVIDLATGKHHVIESNSGSLTKLVAISINHPSQIVIATNERVKEYFDLYSYDLVTHDKNILLENTEEYAQFIFGNDLNLVFAGKILPSGALAYSYFKESGEVVDEWMVVPFEDTETTSLLGVTHDNQWCYVVDSNCSQLWSINLETEQKIYIGDSDIADISDVIVDQRSGKIQAYATEYLRTEYCFIDKLFQSKWNLARKIYDDLEADMMIASRSYNNEYWVIRFDIPSYGVKYYLYNTKKHQAEFLFDYMSSLSQYRLNPMECVIIEARDGLNLAGYLTLPQGARLDQNNNNISSKKYPLIIEVHGGPVARDSYGYNRDHQWLSNRGFAVLSVNYRSSSGFGKEFIRAGDGQWSKKMHEDILDAVQWAIDHNITDRNTVGIYGGSYGGYEVLVALSMTPDVFCCGVDVVGPSNLETLYNSIPPYWDCYVAIERRRFGLPEEPSDRDREILAESSPCTYAHQISKPILIAQGANDVRVKQAESDQIVDIMREHNIPYTYMLFHNEGHGFVRPENRLAFYAEMELFLHQNFLTKYEQAQDELLRANLTIDRFIGRGE